MKSTLLLILIVLIGVGCTNSNSENAIKGQINVEITPSSDTLAISTLFNNYRSVELKGKLLSYIKDVEIVDSLLVVQSKSKLSDIHLFTLDGEYIRSLVGYGKAAYEVQNIQSMSYNPYTETIDVLCNFGEYICKCPLDGSQITVVDMFDDELYFPNDILALDSTKYLVYTPFANIERQENKLHIFDSRIGKITDDYMPFDRVRDEKISVSQYNNLSIDDKGQILFYESHKDSIFVFKDGEVKPQIVFNENKYSYPSSNIDNYADEMDFLDQSINGDYIWAHRNFISYEDKMISSFTYLKEFHLNIIDKSRSTSNSYTYVNDNIVTNKIYKANLFNFISVSDEKAICKIYDDADADNPNESILIFSNISAN